VDGVYVLDPAPLTCAKYISYGHASSTWPCPAFSS